MANTLAEVTPKLLAQGLMALREMTVMPQLVNRQYDAMAGERGSTIDVPIPSVVAANVVAPGSVPPSTQDIAPTSVPIPLDQWYEAPFYLTDRDLLEAQEGTLPMQASEAIKALANNVDGFILDLYKKVSNTYWANDIGFPAIGTAVVQSFVNGTTDATALRRDLHKTLAPNDDRRVVMPPQVEAQALNIRAFQDASYSGSVMELIEGKLNRKLGFDWFMDQNVRTHTSGFITVTPNVNAQTLVGATAVVIQTVAGEDFAANEGDIVQFSNHAQLYVVRNTLDAIGASATGSITISPALKVQLETTDAIAVDTAGAAADTAGTYDVNLAFHRNAFAFATRPLLQSTEGLGAMTSVAVDPVSGLALRLEVTREHKRTRYSYDILYGAALIREELVTRFHTAP